MLRRETLEEILNRFEAAWPDPAFDTNRREVYWGVLRDLDDAAVAAAGAELIRTDRSSQPPPGVVRHAALRATGRTGDQPPPAPFPRPDEVRPETPLPTQAKPAETPATPSPTIKETLPPLRSSRGSAASEGAEDSPGPGFWDRHKADWRAWAVAVGILVVFAAIVGAIALLGQDQSTSADTSTFSRNAPANVTSAVGGQSIDGPVAMERSIREEGRPSADSAICLPRGELFVCSIYFSTGEHGRYSILLDEKGPGWSGYQRHHR